MPRRAAHFHLQAAHALIELGEPDEALTRVRRGLESLAAVGQPGRAARAASRFIEEFRARGYTAQADALALTPHPPLPAETSQPGEAESRRGTLPAKCPHCGGAMRSDEVDWIDMSSAECDYCGSVVKTLT